MPGRMRQSDAGEAHGDAMAATHNPLAATLSLFSCDDCGAQYLVGQSIPSFSSRGRMRGGADAAADRNGCDGGGGYHGDSQCSGRGCVGGSGHRAAAEVVAAQRKRQTMISIESRVCHY